MNRVQASRYLIFGLSIYSIIAFFLFCFTVKKCIPNDVPCGRYDTSTFDCVSNPTKCTDCDGCLQIVNRKMICKPMQYGCDFPPYHILKVIWMLTTCLGGIGGLVYLGNTPQTS